MRSSSPSGGGFVTRPLLKLLVLMRLVAISAILVAALLIQSMVRAVLPIGPLYAVVAAGFALSLLSLLLYMTKMKPQAQASIQLVGDTVLVTALVYATGAFFSPFSALYFLVIAGACWLFPMGGYAFAALSVLAYAVMGALIYGGVVPLPPTLAGESMAMPWSQAATQVGVTGAAFFAIGFLVTRLAESMRKTRGTLEAEKQKVRSLSAVTEHVMRSLDTGIVAVDLEGNVLQANPAALKILDFHKDPENLPLSDVAGLKEIDWKELLSRSKGSVVKVEGVHSRLGRELAVSVFPLQDDDGKQAGHVVTIQDLQESKLKAEKERVRQRMAAVGEMAARMAHEIRNPLASISGCAQMLAGSQPTNSKEAELLNIVVKEAKRLSQLLDDFLSFARPSPSTRKLVSLAEIIRGCLVLLRGSPKMKPSHKVELKVPDSIKVLADENLLRQAIWNLLMNALEAMPKGGTITIESEVLEDGTLAVRFADTGIGMPEEIRARAFEPFVTTRPGGSGLGLAVVYSAMVHHGGGVDIDSREGKGTVVTLTFPKEAVDASRTGAGGG